jgi:hypothetical protein
MRCCRLVLGLVAAAGALTAVPAIGCSAPSQVSTNLELAAQADAIIVGQVLGGSAGDAEASYVVVHPLAAIKGLMPGQDFLLHGMAIASGRTARFGEPSDPLELEKAHPAAYAGACIRRDFAQGATVLFFLDRLEGEWVPAGGPFARWAEDVTGEDAPWVQLARFYARIAPLDEAQRAALLEAERDALLARADEPAAQAIAADLDRTLAAPPPSVVAEAPTPDDGFYEPGEVTAVQRALDAMRADRDEP